MRSKRADPVRALGAGLPNVRSYTRSRRGRRRTPTSARPTRRSSPTSILATPGDGTIRRRPPRPAPRRSRRTTQRSRRPGTARCSLPLLPGDGGLSPGSGRDRSCSARAQTPTAQPPRRCWRRSDGRSSSQRIAWTLCPVTPGTWCSGFSTGAFISDAPRDVTGFPVRSGSGPASILLGHTRPRLWNACGRGKSRVGERRQHPMRGAGRGSARIEQSLRAAPQTLSRRVVAPY